MRENFFDLLLKKIVNYYYNLVTTSPDLLKNFEEMPIDHVEQKANMAFLKSVGGAYFDCFK